MDHRITYRRRLSYNTTSNGIKAVRTPGGVVVAQYRKKFGKGASCGECGLAIQGIPHLRHTDFAHLKKSQKTVTRAYGGNSCGQCVRDKIVRAFLVEERKIVKRVKAEQKLAKSKSKKGTKA